MLPPVRTLLPPVRTPTLRPPPTRDHAANCPRGCGCWCAGQPRRSADLAPHISNALRVRCGVCRSPPSHHVLSLKLGVSQLRAPRGGESGGRGGGGRVGVPGVFQQGARVLLPCWVVSPFAGQQPGLVRCGHQVGPCAAVPFSRCVSWAATHIVYSARRRERALTWLGPAVRSAQCARVKPRGIKELLRLKAPRGFCFWYRTIFCLVFCFCFCVWCVQPGVVRCGGLHPDAARLGVRR